MLNIKQRFFCIVDQIFTKPQRSICKTLTTPLQSQRADQLQIFQNNSQMPLLNSMRSRQIHKIVLNHLKNSIQSPLDVPPSVNFSYCFVEGSISSIQRKPYSVSAQHLGNSEEKNTEEQLSATLKNAVLEPVDNVGAENPELTKLRSLNLKKDVEVETLKPNFENKGSLWELFADDERKKGNISLKPTDYGCEHHVCKKLSPDMLKFAYHLYLEGYLKGANFMPRQEFDLACFERMGFARGFLRFATINFAKDHREIVKWLSASDLKKVAIFGCPSLGEKAIRAAKFMRKFFEINEKEVCATCKLNNVCIHANKAPKKSVKELHLDGVTRILTMYAMEITPQQLVVPEEIKKSVSRLLNEIINLSKTVTRNSPKTH